MSSLRCRAIRMRPSSQAAETLTRWPLGCSRRPGAATGCASFTAGAAIWNTCICPGHTRTSTGTPAAASMCAALRASLSRTSDPDTWIRVRGRPGSMWSSGSKTSSALPSTTLRAAAASDQLHQRGERLRREHRVGPDVRMVGARLVVDLEQRRQGHDGRGRFTGQPLLLQPLGQGERQVAARRVAGEHDLFGVVALAAAATCRRRSSRRAPGRRSASGSSGS